MESSSQQPVSSVASPSAISSQESFLAMSHYIPLTAPVTCMYVLLQKKSSAFSLFHMKQGFVLFSFWFVCVSLLALFPLLGIVLFLLSMAATFWGCISSFQGMMTPIPFLISLAERIPVERLRSFFLHLPANPS
jgi:uncharacterized membrane protein